MPFDVVRTGGAWTLTLRGVVDIFEAAELRAASIEAADGAVGGVVVDLGEAEALDISAVQVLLGLKRALGGAGRALRFEGTPARLAESWRMVGLGDELR